MASKIPSNLLNNNDPPHSLPSMTNSMFCEPCSQCEMFQKIMCLNEKKKSVGIKNIPITFIKILAEYISFLLANIFNKCMQVELFVKLLKIAKITHYTKLVAPREQRIIAQYQFYLLFQKYSKK